MAIPVISSSSSVLDFPLNDTWVFSPRASNSPTSWTWTNLPPGIVANPATGAIGGRVSVQGIWISTVKATNSSGDSLVLELPISIYAGTWSNPTSIEVRINATTGALLEPTSLAVKTDTDLLLDVAFYDASSNLLALNLGALKLVARIPGGDEVLFETDGRWTQIGKVSERHYEIKLSVRGGLLQEGLLDFEGAASIVAQAEIRFVHAVQVAGNQIVLQNITPSFPVTITRNLLGTMAS